MAWKKKVWVDNQTPLCAENMNHLEDGIDSKVDKVEKTNKWQLYGIGDKNWDLPNGNTIDTDSRPTPNTVINRNGYGRAQIETPTIDKEIANKKYVDDIRTNLDTKLDTKLDKEYIVLTNTVIAYAEKINNDDAIILTNLYNKYEGITPEIPLFVRDKNNNIALLSFYNPHGLRFQVISNVSDNKYFPIVSWQIGTTKSFSGNGKYYLHNILGQNAWKKDVKARIGVNSDNKLIITDEEGNQTPGQSPSVVVPLFGTNTDIDNMF